MPVKVLVADDSVTMRKVMELTFAGEDVELHTVDSGDAAIAAVARLSPDVVLADLSMSPDGYHVAEQLKGAGLSIPVIVLASQHTPFDPARGAQAGVDDHVVKPFESQAFIDKVLGAAKNKGAAKPAAAAPAPAPSPPRLSVPQPPAAAKPAAPPPALPQRPAPAAPAAPPAAPPRMSAPGAAPAPAFSAPPAVAQKAAAATSAMGDKLAGLGLTPEQAAGVLALSREVVEQVVWEVVPELAETIIREEIRRLTA